ncbi:PREDICTED: LOW QUALITY PROTEIN: glutamate decarboxylase 1-like [Nipponia nippon]|uniref:LOW QUALITY PROTEIN: glutamate decarboxylase 1-like n=1 Tax=Nipponia nippon TaxID=128390 RepID=UPI00051105CF|nr:PREDICTED: LOW QUALITY PROTEIN: glutamate decarboxylase 1-like [Nipponia nippon]
MDHKATANKTNEYTNSKPRDANKIHTSSLQQEGEEKERETRAERFVNYFANTYASGLLPSKNGEGFTEQLLLEVAEILLSYIKRTYDGEKVLDFHHPHRLLEGLQGFSLDLSDQLELLEQILAHCRRETLIYGVKTGHSCYFNQLSSGFDITGLAGERLTATVNTNIRFDDDMKLWLVKFADDMNLVAWVTSYYISATAGTTIYWALDPLCDIADVWNIRLFETLINRFLELAEYLYKELSSRENFGLVFDDEPEHTNVCFWYIPPSLKGRPSGPEWDKLLHQIAPKIKAQMTEEGMTMISYEPQGDKANFFRMVFFNPATGKPDVDFLLEETERLGKDL